MHLQISVIALGSVCKPFFSFYRDD